MASIGVSAIKLIDSDGDPLDDGDGKLNVNATIQAGDLNVGNVDIHLNGGVPLLGDAGDVAAGVLRVTLAGDDPAVGQLENISGKFKVVGATYGTGEGIASLAFRQDVLGASFSGLSIINNDWTYLQVNSKGGLYVTGSEVENVAVQSEPLLIGGRYDSSARTLGNGDAGAVALNASGHLIIAGSHVDDAGFTLGTDSGVMMMGFAGTQSVDTNDAAALKCNPSGELNVQVMGGSTTIVSEIEEDVTVTGTVGHDITGMVSDNNEGVDDSTAEVLKSSTACKRVDMQADSANTGYIYVGGSDVSAVKGIRLAPGDFYSIDCNNTNDIYVLASVDEEDIHFTYYT